MADLPWEGDNAKPENDLPYDGIRGSQELAGADPRLGEIIAQVGPPALALRPVETLPALLRSIVYQQLSGKAAGTILGRVLDAFGEDGSANPHALLSADEDALRACGLSRAKSAAVQDLARRHVSGLLPSREHLLEMTDEEVSASLTAVRGVGPWTAQMVLIFNLGRPDVWPSADLGVQNGYRLIAGLEDRPTAKQLHVEGDIYRPWRSLAAWYLWRAVDIQRESL